MIPLADKVLAVSGALEDARIAHAFGGALALAYYATPRVTLDIDVNVFVEPSGWPDIVAAIEPLGIETSTADVEDGQTRVWWERTPVDLFLNTVALHDAMPGAVRSVPFGDGRITILGAEHLIVCKALFDRPKDWIDIGEIALTVGDFDPSEALRWVDAMIGPGDPRAARLREVLGADTDD